jgi:Arm DNA-binding domain
VDGCRHSALNPAALSSRLAPHRSDVAIRKERAGPAARKLFDGGGLYFLLNPDGSRWWRFKYRIDGREKLLSLGVYPEVTLRRARDRRDEARRLIADGVDPAVERRAEKLAAGENFESIAREWLSLQEDKLTPGSLNRERDRLEDFSIPALESKIVQAPAVPLFSAERLVNRFADAAARAGDEGNLARQVEHRHWRLPPLRRGMHSTLCRRARRERTAMKQGQL